MVQYYSPGVYIEEVESGPVPIQGVATSITGAVGVTVRGPTSGKPVLVTSFNDFQNTFGGFLPPPTDAQRAAWGGSGNAEGGTWWLFPLSVKGYFDNGGQQLYVKRVYASNAATAASGVLGRGLISEITKDAKASATTLSLRHLFGIANGQNLNISAAGANLLVSGTTNPQQFTVSAYDPVALSITINNAPGKALVAATDFVEVAVPTASPTSQTTTLTFSAKEVGDWGNSISVRVRPIAGATVAVAPDSGARVPAFVSRVSGVAALWSLTLDATSAGTIDTTRQVTINGTNYTLDHTSTATVLVIPESIATALSWQANQTTVQQASQPAGGPTVTKTIAAITANITMTTNDPTAALKHGDHILLGTTLIVLSADGTGSTFQVPSGVSPDATWMVGTPVQKLRPGRAPGTVIDVTDGSQLYPTALVEFDNGAQKETAVVQSISGDSITLYAALSNQYYEQNKVRVIEAEVAVRVVDGTGAVTKQETFTGLRLSPDGSPNNLATYVNNQSTLVTVQPGAGLLNSASIFDALTSFPTPPNGGWLPLTGGHDHIDSLSVEDFAGVDKGPGNRTGIQALEDIDEVSICVVPGMWSATIQGALINLCETLKDRFAIIDPPDVTDVAAIRSFREPYDSEYAALYYPWLLVRDPTSSQITRYIHVPPSAHMAGRYADTDNTRGVFKAPANVTVAGIFKFAADINQREQDVLNPIGINALRYFPGRGYRVWGARTLSSDATWKYINVRRIFIYVEKSIQVGTQWVVFEPNDEGTWSRVRQSVTNFLTSFWREGGLQGTTAKEAFFVACDLGVTMTQDDIDNGRLIVQIGIAPVKPAEFVIFQIQQYTRESTAS